MIHTEHLHFVAEHHHQTTQTNAIGTPDRQHRRRTLQSALGSSTLTSSHTARYDSVPLASASETEVNQGCCCLLSSAALQIFFFFIIIIGFKMWHLFFMTTHNNQPRTVCWYRCRAAREQHCRVDVLCLYQM